MCMVFLPSKAGYSVIKSNVVNEGPVEVVGHHWRGGWVRWPWNTQDRPRRTCPWMATRMVGVAKGESCGSQGGRQGPWSGPGEGVRLKGGGNRVFCTVSLQGWVLL